MNGIPGQGSCSYNFLQKYQSLKLSLPMRREKGEGMLQLSPLLVGLPSARQRAQKHDRHMAPKNSLAAGAGLNAVRQEAIVPVPLPDAPLGRPQPKRESVKSEGHAAAFAAPCFFWTGFGVSISVTLRITRKRLIIEAMSNIKIS